jgi:release factor glutamine methyltransferase
MTTTEHLLMNIQTWISQSKLKRSDAADLLFFVLAPQTTLDAKSWVLTNNEIQLSASKLARLNKLCLRRQNNEPIQYILGYTEFGELKLKVNKHVLIPRQETLELVNLVGIHIKDTYNLQPTTYQLHVVDVGTGSGAIAISIAKFAAYHYLPIKVTAADIGKQALNVAKDNFKNSKFEIRNSKTNITFLQGSLLNSITGPFDIIVANLPYIPSTEIPKLSKSVKDYEPTLALDGGKKGLDLIYELIKQAETKLNPKGKIFLELWDEHTKEDFAQFTNFKVKILKDSFGKTRFAVLTKA